MKLTEEQANQVWDILVETCGAANDNDMRQMFVHYTGDTDQIEFRFQGELGFGGKVYYSNDWNPPLVAFYKEDSTLDRILMQGNANEQLCLLWGDWESEREGD